MSFFDDVISTVGRGLAQTAVGALSDATGYDVGGTLNTLFGSGQTTGGENLSQLSSSLQENWQGTPEQLQMLQNGIDQETQMISDLGSQVSALGSAISAIQGQIANIEALLVQINQEQLYQEWQAVDGNLTNFLDAIQTAYGTYGEFLSNFSSTDTDLVVSLVSSILDTNVGPRVGLTALHSDILDEGQRRGALQLWSNMVVPLVTGGLIDYRDAVDQYMAYYQKLAYAQLQATNLVMEAYSFRNSNVEMQAVWKQYRKQLLDQEHVFLTWLVPLVVAGIRGGISPNFSDGGGGFTYTAVEASLQLNPALQRYVASKPGSFPSYYTPSTVFRRAEELLATLYVTGEQDRRIVVHMLFIADQEISGLLTGVNLTLTPAEDGDPVNAISGVRLGGPFSFYATNPDGGPVLDENFATSDFYIKRFIFKADADDQSLADGSYTISNINGSSGLVPMETYVSALFGDAKPQFMNDNVLQYSVSISDAQQFDFMNFMAYMTPCYGPFDWQKN